MKLLHIALVAATTLGSVAITRAQTADEIVAKHISAIGGKEKLMQINSLYQENTIEVMGNEASSTTTILNGKGLKNEVISVAKRSLTASPIKVAGQSTP